MYGLVNRAIQPMVTTHHGVDILQCITERPDLQNLDVCATELAYPEDVTHRLVAEASEELAPSEEPITQAFGEYCITDTATEGYEKLFENKDHPLPEWLHQRDNLHARVAVSFAARQPPSFRCEHRVDASRQLEYRSTRQGLAPLVTGLLHGLGTHFRTPLAIDQIASLLLPDGGMKHA
ncbi:heme NO-binding domain-containing protein [Cyanobium gracile UHCC 0139]|uniref:Heme NO-binding domain-containing protein n=1 Tax=Cyanobium gracile UHCC 0139 TaxID=3110308 RepID=A0ABU5RRK2_9CYAN|nr:heme NO-binding domain-containing protein [Cyanobium gracile]MEA5390379.1 heme NO-binding domain-containing protein [Cyanobium gracile UHCC 0139]